MKPRHIIFIHGWASGPYVWLHQVSYFKDKFDVHSPELRQEGAFDVITDDICNFIIDKKLDNVCLVGWSLGGMVSFKVASNLKKRISHLVLIGTTARFTQSEDFKYAVSKKIVEKIYDRMENDFQGTLDWFYKFCFSSHERSRNEFGEVLKFLGDFIAPFNQETLLAGLKLLMQLDVRYLLKDITMPTLIIQGGQDRVCPVEAAEYLSGKLKNSRIELIEGAGHAPFLTEPKKVNALIKNFLSQNRL